MSCKSIGERGQNSMEIALLCVYMLTEPDPVGPLTFPSNAAENLLAKPVDPVGCPCHDRDARLRPTWSFRLESPQRFSSGNFELLTDLGGHRCKRSGQRRCCLSVLGNSKSQGFSTRIHLTGYMHTWPTNALFDPPTESFETYCDHWSVLVPVGSPSQQVLHPSKPSSVCILNREESLNMFETSTQQIRPHRFGGEGVLIGVQTATLNAQSHLLI